MGTDHCNYPDTCQATTAPTGAPTGAPTDAPTTGQPTGAPSDAPMTGHAMISYGQGYCSNDYLRGWDDKGTESQAYRARWSQ